MDSNELGHIVAKRRRQKGLSQEAFAKQAGVSRNYLSLIERGEATNVSTSILEKLAAILETSPAELLAPTPGMEMTYINPALREFALRLKLPFDVVDRLARLPRRGTEPTTVEAWEKLYESLRAFI